MQSLVSSETHVLRVIRNVRVVPEYVHFASPCVVTTKKYKGAARIFNDCFNNQRLNCTLIGTTNNIAHAIRFCSMPSRKFTSSIIHSTPVLLSPPSYSNHSLCCTNISSFSTSRSSSANDATTHQQNDPQFSPKASDALYDGTIDIVASDSATTTFSATWLRENCRCADCYYEATNQRKVLFHHLPRAALTTTDVSSDRNNLNVTWADGHKSRYDLAWLRRNSTKSLHELPSVKRVIWSKRELSDARNVCRVKFEELVTGKLEESRRCLLAGLVKFGFAFVDGTPTTTDATMEVASRICAPLRTLYGDQWTFGDTGGELTFADTAYTSEPLGAHTDGTYYRTPPGVQILHCLGHEGGTGGESLLVDGFNAAKELRARDPVAFQVLTRHTFDHQYIDDKNCLHSSATVLKVDPFSGGLEWIRYNPYDRSPLVPSTVRPPELGTAYNALARLGAILEAPDNQYWIKLRPGSVMLMDNWRVLHGRAAYTGRRVMTGCYLGRDEWLSAARLAGVM